jgi:hypothetical protein
MEFSLYTPDLLELAFATGSLAWLFSERLTDPGEVFGWWPPLVERVTTWHPARKLLYGCAKCMAGSSTLLLALALGYGLRAFLASGLAILVALGLGRWLD